MTEVGTLITANAGCGKTFTLANRVLGWLVEHHRLSDDRSSGVADVMAATFTRKAAGEIQQRVLRHLSRGAIEPEQLASYQNAIALDPPPTAAELLAVLEDVARHIDRLQINTLDGIFHQLAHALPEQVGLPQGWTIADQPAMKALQRAAIDTWLQSCAPAEVRELASAAEGEVLKGSMHDAITKTIWGDGRGGGLLDLWRRSKLVSGDTDPWEWFDGLSDQQISPTSKRLDQAGIETAADILADIPVPMTQAGTPNKNWMKAHDRILVAARDGRWSDILTDTLVAAAVEGKKFSRVAVPDDMSAAMAPLISHACQQLVDRLRTRIHIWRSLLASLAEAYSVQQRAAGQYSFGDIADRLARADVLSPEGMESLAWRLDARIRDLALDEFQDTSVEQARVLSPLLNEMFAGDGSYDTPRHMLVVADRKQSIYGWRGGTPMLIDWLKQDGGDELVSETIAESWRSSPVIMNFVNTCFGGIGTNPALVGERDRRLPTPPALAAACGLVETGPPNAVDAAIARWEFTPHVSAPPLASMPGRACAYVAVEDEAAELAATIVGRRLRFASTIGVLCPSNANVAAVADALRAAGIAVSQEGSGKVDDIVAAARLLDVLRLGEHPGHTAAAFRVSHSPFGKAINLAPLELLPDRVATMASVSATMRRLIIDRGLPEMLAELVDAIASQVDDREYAALRRIVTIAAAWDSAHPRRLTDFVAHVEQTGLGEASTANVRVMTMHASKGLEFDEVVLPWIDAKMVKEVSPVCRGWSVDPLGAIRAIAPMVTKEERLHTPIMRAFHEQAFAGDLADRLSLLYVAITRARSGLHLLFRPFKKKNSGVGDSLSPATFLRAAIPEIEASLEGKDTTLPVHIWKSADSSDDAPESAHVIPTQPVANLVQLRPSVVGSLVTPSSHDAMPLRDQCRMVPSDARRDGVILHELFRAVGWIEDGVPGDAVIDHAFDEAAIQLARPVPDDLRQTLRKRFEKALAGNVSIALRRDAHAAWNATSLDVLPEHPMLVRLDDGMLRGRIDRLVLGRDASGVVTNAAIIDFKTGHADSKSERQTATEWYQPQLDRYAEGVAAIYQLPLEAIESGLLFVQ